ncbi:MAG: hypothetical protein HUU35_19175, partial [Armatimonadetes bacterium]|nr:hypothetical protein [Armatimonadota bacterium]
MGQWLCLAALMAAGAGERGWYSADKLAIMRRNLAEHDWARAQRDAIVKRAAVYVDWTPPQLQALVPPPQVPRAIIVHDSGCPVHGATVNVIGRYSWKVSPAEPWKIRCPVGGEAYPSNDFAAYLASGLKDTSLLTGEFADDGWGWRKPGAEKKFWFVAYYAQWLAYNHLLPALHDLSRAYLLTDDPRYAQATIILLRQLAEYYPDYLYEKQSRYGTEFDPRYHGRLLYHTWECFTVQAVAPAFDAVQPLLNQADRQVIEDRLLRTMARDIMDGSNRVQGNYGMHQVGLVQIAAGLRGKPGEPSSEAMIDWVLHNDQATQYTGIGLEDALYNLVQRDGYPFESPGYNVAWNRDLNLVAEALAGSGINLYGNSRLRKLLHWPLALLTAGEFTPASGDSNNMFGLATGIGGDLGGPAFAAYGSPEWAVALQQVGASP